MKNFEIIEEYIETVAKYYESSNRPYSELGVPIMVYGNWSPNKVLNPGMKMLLLGPPASGKTTFLDWIAQYASKTSTWIPIFISLRNYVSTLEDLINVSLSKFVPNIRLKDLIPNALTRWNIVLLFDGLDEVPATLLLDAQKSIFHFIESLQSVSVVVTTRTIPKTSGWKNWQQTEISRLSQEQVYTYLSSIPKGLSLYNQIVKNPNLMDLVSRPAFLFTISTAWSKGLNYRDYLMREIPAYTAWRGHTKSHLDVKITPKTIDKTLTLIALDTVVRNQRNFTQENLEHIISQSAPKQENYSNIMNAVLSTDVILDIDKKNYSFSHSSFLESYAARGLLDNLRSPKNFEILLKSVINSNYSSSVIQYFLTILDQNELVSLTKFLSPILSEAILNLGRNVIADRMPELSNESLNPTEKLISAATMAEKFLANQASSRRDILVFAVHGFNTRGDWKNRLGFNLSRATDGERFIYAPWDYGEFRMGILFPWARKTQVKKFHEFYNRNLSMFTIKPEICVVAHSFGTYIIAHALRRFPEIHINKILFLGSALPCNFKLQHLKNRIGMLFNLICPSDFVLRIARIIPGLGDAGRRGFFNTPDWLIQETEFYSHHSDLFGDEYMNTVWLQFFRDGTTPYQSQIKDAV